ncbi:IS110 family RNA-guided transposase [Tautonia plasticadhaerens]|uniref:Transposase IS116/IS110/IS902 family protein n=1 Tax=Tautonia plasticadhaerens TaxID=2527974 RepID=A0A518HDC7_9BACT|nr:IS110 family transposase [Tautonia plasticadhaerens]QDV36177.1 Transposase IS116/IS110/IS902 family protein [Tautonia plasticadhaerens]QDV36287.1 Transposase IS116/IS110/IS902 family protein [Tautonia plasticadhaerens]QDV37725.1 Transposase IS116/IS110/IS902 family protein [Tautonia plasticadhaerens]QDV38865.1 Transposase IS116/IS110/IS902 family protein [Tautonia plasticadhaerens]
MPATHDRDHSTASTPTLYLAFELGWTTWKLAFADAPARAPRQVTIPARDTDALRREIARARRRLGLPDDAPVRSVFEAGRDGFWLHRYLIHHGHENLVVDPASIEVNRRARRAKSDGLDVVKLLAMLQRHHGGERGLWAVVNVPAPEDEDRRAPQRELMALKAERTEHSNRIKGLLAHLGLAFVVDGRLPERLAALRQWDGRPVPEHTAARLLREFERWKLVDAQVRDRENAQRRAVRDDAAPHVEQVRRLMDLKGVGPVGAWLLVQEIFGWRRIKNRRELASLVGLVPTPYQSGSSHREQGISKAGNRRVRWMLVELAWMWLQYQPRSALSRWYHERFGSGNARARKVGIVALARKLLVAFWKYLEFGEAPEGAEMVPWRKKLNGRLPAGTG